MIDWYLSYCYCKWCIPHESRTIELVVMDAARQTQLHRYDVTPINRSLKNRHGHRNTQKWTGYDPEISKKQIDTIPRYDTENCFKNRFWIRYRKFRNQIARLPRNENTTPKYQKNIPIRYRDMKKWSGIRFRKMKRANQYASKYTPCRFPRSIRIIRRNFPFSISSANKTRRATRILYDIPKFSTLWAEIALGKKRILLTVDPGRIQGSQ